MNKITFYCNECYHKWSGEVEPAVCPVCGGDEVHIDGTDNDLEELGNE